VSFETRKKANRFKAGYNGFTGYLLKNNILKVTIK